MHSWTVLFVQMTHSPMDRFNSASPGSGDGMRDADRPREATLQCPPGADQTIPFRELRVAVVSCDATALKKLLKSEVFWVAFYFRSVQAQRLPRNFPTNLQRRTRGGCATDEWNGLSGTHVTARRSSSEETSGPPEGSRARWLHLEFRCGC